MNDPAACTTGTTGTQQANPRSASPALAANHAPQFLLRIIRTLPEVLMSAVRLNPRGGIHHVADDGGERLQSYRDLLDGARCVLGGLRTRGVAPGEPVIVQVEDDELFLECFWGLVLGGMLPVPLPVPGSYPVGEGLERVESVSAVLKDFRVVTDRNPARYADLGAEGVYAARELREHAPDTRHHRPDPDDVAFLQFSSGSTGEPKGVILTHRNLLASMDASTKLSLDVRGHDVRPTIGYVFHILRSRLGITAPGPLARALGALERAGAGRRLGANPFLRELWNTALILSGARISAHLDMRLDELRVVNWMPFSHDMGLIGFHLAPTMGGLEQVKLSTRTFIEQPALFLRLIDRLRASHVPCPNFATRWLTAQVRDEDIAGIDLSCVRALFNGSEPVSARDTRAFLDKFAPCGLSERAMCITYGMAEAVLQVSAQPAGSAPLFHRLDAARFAEGVVRPVAEGGIEVADVGSPVAGLTVRVVNGEGEPLHEQEIGQVEIRGLPVTSGYYRRDPGDLFNADGWLRTGDMGFMHEGRLAVTGRHKDVIFLQGRNVYAHDIEDVIREVPGMVWRDFAVCGVSRPEEQREDLVLFVCGREMEPGVTLARINAHLGQRLGVRCERLVSVEQIPRTPSAKIRRFMLRDDYVQGLLGSGTGADDAAVGPCQSDEEVLAGECALAMIWSEVLECGPVGRHDNFFDLGGNSLRATRLVARIRDELGLDVSVADVFEFQSVAALTAVLDDALMDEFPPLTPRDRDESRPLSLSQERLWYHERLLGSSAVYLIPGAVMIEGPEIDFALLQQALQRVARRHEVLRAVFAEQDGRPVMSIAPERALDFVCTDLRGLPDAGGLCTELLEQEKRQPFDLHGGPVFRVRAVRLSDTRTALMIVMHHIVSDGGSVRLFVQEAIQGYLSLRRGETPADEIPAVQYGDWALWQRTLLDEGLLDSVGEWWGEQLLVDPPEPLALPCCGSGDVRDPRAGTVRRRLDPQTAARLAVAARGHDVTPYMFTLAAFAVLLHRLGGQERFVVGSPASGRTRAGLQGLIGFFVNMLPLKLDLSGEPVFGELLSRVRETAVEAFARQDFPFNRMVEMVNPERDPGRTPLIDAAFEYVERSENVMGDLALGDIRVRNITGDAPAVPFALSLNLTADEEGLALRLEYRASLFAPDAMERLAETFEHLLCLVLEDPGRPVDEYDLTAPQHRDRLTALEGADVPVARECVHEMFAAAALRHPRRDAVIAGPERFTYADLDRRAAVLAGCLAGRGVKPGTRVALLLGRGSGFIIAQLAVWRLGAAFVPLDPGLPSERIRRLCDDAGVVLVLGEECGARTVTDRPVMILGEVPEDGPEAPPVTCSPVDPAYVIYTSGSTGEPKGVVVSHHNLVNLIAWWRRRFALNDDDRASLMAGVGFDATIIESWPYLTCGAAVCCHEPSLSVTSPEELVAWCRKLRITRAFIPTAFVELFFRAAGDELSLKTAFTGGEHLRVVPRNLPCPLVNCYGPTETTVLVTAGEVTAAVTPPHIGRPMDNVRLTIVDRCHRPLPPGLPGELLIAGLAVGGGYLHDPERTAEAFVMHEGRRCYRSGDRVRLLEDGALSFLGRLDEQAAIRGYRVEPAEVEAALREHPAVRECAVLVVERGRSTQVAACCVSPGAGAEELRAHLETLLPAYMIPARFVALERLPLNPSGKVDRRALETLVAARGGEENARPRTEVERLLSVIWAEVLERDAVGIEDNFFDLGGDSILSLKVVSRLGELGYALEPRAVLEHQTISELAPCLEARDGRPRGPVSGRGPLTPMQQWFMAREWAESRHFNQALLIRPGTLLDVGACERALQMLLDHHDGLRSRFDGDGVEVVPPGVRVQLLVAGADEPRGLDLVQALQSSFDLREGPLFGCALIQGCEMDELLFCAHHLVVDAVSWRILLEDFARAYTAVMTDREVILPRRTLSVLEWARALETRTAEMERTREYLQTLKSFPADPFPADLDEGCDNAGRVFRVDRELSAAHTLELLQGAVRARGLDVEQVLCAALARGLAGWGDLEGVLLAVERHGRDALEGLDVSRTVGWFTALFPVSLSLDEADPAVMLAKVRERLDGVPARGIFCAVPGLADELPEPPVSLNYLGRIAADTGAELTVPFMSDEHNRRAAAIEVQALTVGECLRFEVAAGSGRYRKETIESLADCILAALADLIDWCALPGGRTFDLVDLDDKQLDELSSFNPGG